jgi:hypothetical protein
MQLTRIRIITKQMYTAANVMRLSLNKLLRECIMVN